MNNKEYWDKKIIEWENSMWGKGANSPIEKLATHFRKPTKFRTEYCVNLLKEFVKDKTILDVGCGSGFFDFELYTHARPKHITGMDISQNAVNRAQAKAKEKQLDDKIQFCQGDILTDTLPEADLTIAMGLLDYLTLEQINTLFNKINSKYFIFSFVENSFSVLRLIHIIYLWTQKYSHHFYYSKDQVAKCIPTNFSDIQFLNDRRLSFAGIVHNLPQNEIHLLPMKKLVAA